MSNSQFNQQVPVWFYSLTQSWILFAVLNGHRGDSVSSPLLSHNIPQLESCHWEGSSPMAQSILCRISPVQAFCGVDGDLDTAAPVWGYYSIVSSAFWGKVLKCSFYINVKEKLVANIYKSIRHWRHPCFKHPPPADFLPLGQRAGSPEVPSNHNVYESMNV